MARLLGYPLVRLLFRKNSLINSDLCSTTAARSGHVHVVPDTDPQGYLHISQVSRRQAAEVFCVNNYRKVPFLLGSSFIGPQHAVGQRAVVIAARRGLYPVPAGCVFRENSQRVHRLIKGESFVKAWAAKEAGKSSAEHKIHHDEP